MFEYINLRLFEDGGSGAPSVEGTGAPQPQQSTVAAKKGETVVYGKQEQPAPQIQQELANPEDRKTAFQKAREEYKDLFQAETQNIINQRFRQTKQLEKQVADVNPIIEMLSERYGTNDLTELMSKVRDESLETLAERENMTVEQYEATMKLRQENKLLKRQQETRDEETKINQMVSDWNSQAETVKVKYPNFNLADDLQNPEFVKMLQSGVTVKAAYEVIHMDDIIAGTAQRATQNTVESIKAKANRPAEGAAKSTPGVIFKTDVSKLSKEDRAAIAKKVMAGEKIEF